ncbi:ras-related protein Rab-9A [Petromyzon marinus]|uniref:small monomeric GTPase n=1 Tax=Petromyzon marinus TaxID=7757 RepID=A0AAJ7UI97_PETMA|nr:ras-related protein Rab-9A [Petromyzon marinus]XP_032836787.1 ras-related protein Rab-9A [Petromyzon marinus]
MSGAGGAPPKATLLKVILLGDGGVGKSSLMNRYVSNTFDAQSFHTIGVEFLNKDLSVDGRAVTMQIWDTAGQERFRSLRTPFYRGSDACLLTFSLDDAHSFRSLDAWRSEFAYYADVAALDAFPFVLLGNKLDLPHREVSAEEVSAWCRSRGDVPYFETSARDSTNVALAFEEAARRAITSDLRQAGGGGGAFTATDTVSLGRHGDGNSSRSCC